MGRRDAVVSGSVVLPRFTNKKEMQMLNRVKQFLVNDDGPTATEYAVMLALIIIVCIAGITLLGNTVNGVFNTVAGGLPSGAPA